MHIRTAPAVLLSVVVLFLGAACSPASPTSPPGPASVEGPARVPRAPSPQSLELTPIDPSSSLAGTYMLTIRAADDCLRLPESVRLRQYTATIEQSGSGLRVILSGASLHVVEELGPHPRG